MLSDDKFFRRALRGRQLTFGQQLANWLRSNLSGLWTETLGTYAFRIQALRPFEEKEKRIDLRSFIF
jgi:hypothetical protein